MAEEKSNQQVAVELRRTMQAAVGFLRGAELRESIGAVTFDELLSQQIELIEGTGTDTRPGILAKIEAIRTSLHTTTAQLRQLPEEAVATPQEEEDANTPVDAE